MARGLCLVLMALGALLAASISGSVRAATDQARADCQTRVPDRAIAGCTAVLGRPQFKSSQERSTAFNNRGFAYKLRGDANGTMEDYDRAIADLDKAIELDPNNISAYTNRGDAYESKGASDLARADFDEAIRIDPNHALSYRQRAFAELNKGDYEHAIADVDLAIRLAPKGGGAYLVSDAYALRGMAYKAKGEVDRANADFDQANRLIKPVSADDHALQCANFARKGDFDRALVSCEKAIQLDPQNAPAGNNFCWIYREKGEVDRAIRACDEALRRHNLGRSYYHRGLAYEKKGDLDRALADLVKYREMKPSDAIEGPAAESRVRHAIAERRMAAADPVASPASPVTPTSPASTGGRERRIALVIGNAHYQSVSLLANPARDAASIATALTNAGFEVTAKNDLTYDGLRQTLAAFADEAAKADWAVVYYAGHGIEVGGTNYLVPIDARLLRDTSVTFEAIALSTVRDAVSGAHKLHLVILDACRENPFGQRMQRTTAQRAVTRGLARPAETDEPGDLVVYAAKEGELAEDGTDSANSPFVAAFIRELAGPPVQIRELFDAVSDDVNAATGGRQRPILYGRLPARQSFYVRAP